MAPGGQVSPCSNEGESTVEVRITRSERGEETWSLVYGVAMFD